MNSYSAQGIAGRRRKNPYLPAQTTQTRSNPYPFKPVPVQKAFETRLKTVQMEQNVAFLCAG